MRELFELFFEYLNEHWIKFVIAGLFMGAGWFFGKRRARREWRTREFLGRLNFSLNTLDEGVLKIRTLSEKSCEDVFLNQVAAESVTASAKLTTPENPTLPLEKDEYWFYLNSVLNELSEQFAEGLLRRDMSLPVKSEEYVICLTSESAGEMRTRKVRAMVVRKSLLANLPHEKPKFEAESHSTRWTTLTLLSELYQKEPWKFLTVELCMPS